MISCRHALLDDRIYKKEAVTLARNGYEVIHVGYGETNRDYRTPDHIRIIERKKEKKGKTFRSWRIAFMQLQLGDLFHAAASVAADIYHLHDMELCRIASKLQKMPHRPKVIYDAHEPFVDNLRDYWRERSPFKILLNDIPSLTAEKRFLKKADYLIATEENVASRFRKHNVHTDVIYNYSYFYPETQEEQEKKYDTVYSGLLSKSKGIFLMLQVLIAAQKQGKNYSFVAVGPFESPSLQAEVEAMIRREGLEKQVVFTGEIPLEEVSRYYRQSKAAFCLFPFNRTNQRILPIKLFEYAAFGLPVIGSRFGHIREIIESNRMGVTVCPDAAEEAAAILIDLISGNQYTEYSRNGIQCVKDYYLWETQEKKLLRVYENLSITAIQTLERKNRMVKRNSHSSPLLDENVK
jgi:glycosyltransferase involved in cell wall biosynthesis